MEIIGVLNEKRCKKSKNILFGVYNEGVANFGEHISFMDSVGFIPYDFLESHYCNGFNMQIDMLFINKNHN